MYESYFGLKERPYSISPDPRFIYLSAQHQEALAKSQYAISQKMGISTIYGDIGAGKTSLARRLWEQYAADPKFDEQAVRTMIQTSNEANKIANKGASMIADPMVRKAAPLEARTAVQYYWQEQPDILARAMIVADSKIFIAGHPDMLNEERAFLEPDAREVKEAILEQERSELGEFGAKLQAYSAVDGKQLAEYDLEDRPVFQPQIGARRHEGLPGTVRANQAAVLRRFRENNL